MHSNYAIIIDNSQSMSSLYDSISYMEYARAMSAEFLQQKLISNSRDHATFITPSESSKDVIMPLEPITSRFINNLMEYKFSTTSHDLDFLQLLTNTVDYLKYVDKPTRKIKILAFGSFCGDSSLAEALCTENALEIDFIVPFSCFWEKELSRYFKCNVYTFQEFALKLETINVEELISRKPTAWRCCLEIGSDIKIPVVSYIKTKKACNTNLTSRVSLGEMVWSPLKRKTTYSLKGDDSVVEDVCSAYHYGGSVVGFTPADEDNARIRAGKCFQLLGFTRTKNIHRAYWTGDSVSVVAGENGSTLPALVRACAERDVVCIVRRVFARNFPPRIGFLLPSPPNFFYWSELAFTEDIKPVVFNSLPTPNLESDDKIAAVSQMIDAFDLEKKKCSILTNFPANYYTQRLLRKAQQKMFPGRHHFEGIEDEEYFFDETHWIDPIKAAFPHLEWND